MNEISKELYENKPKSIACWKGSLVAMDIADSWLRACMVVRLPDKASSGTLAAASCSQSHGHLASDQSVYTRGLRHGGGCNGDNYSNYNLALKSGGG